MPSQVMGVVGCDECRQTGYFGRIGIDEMLELNVSIRNLIGADIDSKQLRQVALAEGMPTLRLSGADKAGQGLTTAEEIFSVLHHDQ